MRSLYMSKRDNMSNRKVCFPQALLLTGLTSEVKGPTLRRWQCQLQETIQAPGLSARLPTQGLKHQGDLGWRQLSSETWSHQRRSHKPARKSTFISTVQLPVQSALSVSGLFFTSSQKVSWNRFTPSCKKSSISFWMKCQSAITVSWPVVSSRLWFVP